MDVLLVLMDITWLELIVALQAVPLVALMDVLLVLLGLISLDLLACLVIQVAYHVLEINVNVVLVTSYRTISVFLAITHVERAQQISHVLVVSQAL